MTSLAEMLAARLGAEAAAPAGPTPPGRAPSPAQIDAARRILEGMGVSIVVGGSTIIEMRREIAS